MTIEITCIDVELSDRSKKMIYTKLEKLKRFLVKDEVVKVTCKKKGKVYTVEGLVNLPRGQVVRAEESGHVLSAAVIDVEDSLERQLRKKKEKRITRKKGASGIVGTLSHFDESLSDDE